MTVIELPFKVTNRHGVTFLVRIVEKGDGYGVDDKVIHDEDDPMVEFYDQRYTDERFGPRGQFVSRYYLSTLLERPVVGIDLHHGIESWYVTAENMAEVLRYVLVHLTQRKRES